MESVSELPTEACTACQHSAKVFYPHHGDRICGGCKAVFAVAKLLYRDGASDEAEIMATLAYAARYCEHALAIKAGGLAAKSSGT